MLICLILCLRPCLAQIYMFVCISMLLCLHMLVCLDMCSSILLCLHPHAQMYIYMPTCISSCLYVQIGVFTCLDRCSLHALCHHLCACMLHAMFMCLGLDLVCHGMCYCSPFVPFIAFSCVLARSRPYGLCHRPYTMAHIKTVWIIPICMSMLAYFYALCLCQPLQFQALPCLTPLTSLWLCGYIRRP